MSRGFLGMCICDRKFKNEEPNLKKWRKEIKQVWVEAEAEAGVSITVSTPWKYYNNSPRRGDLV